MISEEIETNNKLLCTEGLRYRAMYTTKKTQHNCSRIECNLIRFRSDTISSIVFVHKSNAGISQKPIKSITSVISGNTVRKSGLPFNTF